MYCGAKPVENKQGIRKEPPKVGLPPVKTFTVNGVSFNMILVEGGSFYYGLDADTYKKETLEGKDYKRIHPLVTVQSFYIGETQVTQALWEAVMENKDPLLPFEKKPIFNPSSFKGKNLPLDFGDGQHGPSMSDKVMVGFFERLNDLTSEEFRLPGDGEWEFAAKGGNKSKGYKYAGSDNIDDVAWYVENSGNKKERHSRFWSYCGKTHDVKTKMPNELGIYDMCGNVAEYVGLYGIYNLSHCDARFRGGGWRSPCDECIIVYDNNKNSSENCGFRLALSIKRQ